MNKILNFFKSIFSWFGRAATKHNAVAVLTTVERVGVAAAEVNKGDIAGAMAEVPEVVSAAKSIHVNQVATPSAPSTGSAK